MSSGYRVNTLITIFNAFDSIGRYIPNYIKISKNQLPYMTFLRLIFLFSYPILIYIEKDSEVVDEILFLKFLFNLKQYLF